MIKETASMPGVLTINLFNTPGETSDDLLKPCCVVVVDVLRSATSIVTALANGAREVMPTASAAAGIELSQQLSRKDIMLCGERDGKVVEGFDLGNSPSEFTRERVAGRTIIFGSTNGTPMVVKASGARQVFMCGLINLDAVIRALLENDMTLPVAIACAGQDGLYALDDVVCGGLLISRIRSRTNLSLNLNDAAVAAEIISRDFGNDLLALIRSTDHGRYLMEIGAERDLAPCAEDSTLLVVPVWRDGKLASLKFANE